MARGWESKAVADQIEEGNPERPALDDRVNSAKEDRVQRQRMQSLILSRSRLLQQLERATHPSHRQVLQNGLKAVESELEELRANSAEG